jgi:hypothetical protein
MEKIIPASCRVYGRLLIFYPGEFRRRFGAEMTQLFEELLRDAAQRGPIAIISLWRSALWELLSVAAPLRLQNAAVIAGALSFVASSLLFLAFFRAVS